MYGKTWKENQIEKRARKINFVMGVITVAVLIATFWADYQLA